MLFRSRSNSELAPCPHFLEQRLDFSFRINAQSSKSVQEPQPASAVSVALFPIVWQVATFPWVTQLCRVSGGRFSGLRGRTPRFLARQSLLAIFQFPFRYAEDRFDTGGDRLAETHGGRRTDSRMDEMEAWLKQGNLPSDAEARAFLRTSRSMHQRPLLREPICLQRLLLRLLQM